MNWESMIKNESLHMLYFIEDDNGNNTWPDILKFLFDCASSTNVMLKESGLIIFRYLLHS